MAPKFGYWSIKGRGGAAKMALAYAGEDYEDIVYDMKPIKGADDPRATSREDWERQKSKLGLPLPNLPWYIDENVKLTQSNAILRHIGRKYNLYGQNDIEASEIDMLIDTALDILDEAVKVAFDLDWETSAKKHPEAMEPKMKQLSDYIGSKKFLLGDKITIADFAMYVALDYHTALDEECLKKFPNLDNYIKNINSEPKIKAFFKSDKYFKDLCPPHQPIAKLINK